jgi:hypothetical protein
LFIGSIPIAASNKNQWFPGSKLTARFRLGRCRVTGLHGAFPVQQLFEAFRSTLLHRRQNVSLTIFKRLPCPSTCLWGSAAFTACGSSVNPLGKLTNSGNSLLVGLIDMNDIEWLGSGKEKGELFRPCMTSQHCLTN